MLGRCEKLFETLQKKSTMYHLQRVRLQFLILYYRALRWLAMRDALPVVIANAIIVIWWLAIAAFHIIILWLNSMFGSSDCEVFTWSRIFRAFNANSLLFMFIGVNVFIALREGIRRIPNDVVENSFAVRYINRFFDRIVILLNKIPQPIVRIISRTAVVLLILLMAITTCAVVYVAITGNLCK